MFTWGASASYLIAVLCVWAVASFRNDVARRCAELLLVWFILANAVYVRGEIETFSTIVIGLIYVVLCGFATWKYQHWLPIYLCASGVVIILWSFAYMGPSAYTYKSIKNAIFIGELLAVLIECINNGRRRV